MRQCGDRLYRCPAKSPGTGCQEAYDRCYGACAVPVRGWPGGCGPQDLVLVRRGTHPALFLRAFRSVGQRGSDQCDDTQGKVEPES